LKTWRNKKMNSHPILAKRPALAGCRAALLAALCVVSTQAATTPPAIGAQVSAGYSNLASAQLLQASGQYSSSLSRAGFIPAESLAGATVSLEGQTAHAGGTVHAPACEYGYRDGALREIRRADLFRDHSPQSLILRHLTNEVLTLTAKDAPTRALGLLRSLSYDATEIQGVYRMAVKQDLMDAYPVRDGGTNFPKDLHFFGELISRKKIRLCVDFTPKDAASPTNQRDPGTIHVELLATTGELLSARLPDPDALASLGIHSPERFPAIESPDFSPPVFVSATRNIAIPPSTITASNAVALLHQTWDELQQKVGRSPVRCYLVCDNLNRPEALATEVAKLAGNIPWAGASHFWRTDLPFDRAMMEQLSHNRRGIAILAICGDAQTQLEAIGDLSDIPVPREGDKASQARFAKDRQEILPRVTDLMRRIQPSASAPDTALFMIQASPNFASRVVMGEIESPTFAWAQVVDATGAKPYTAIGDGVAYYNGAVKSNTLVVLRLSGSLPLRRDTASLLRGGPERRLIGQEVSAPITCLAYSFGPHPMQELFDHLGPGLIALLQHADKVESFRIKPNLFGEPVPPGRPSLDGHEIIARGKPLRSDFAKQLATAILNDRNVLGVRASCEFMPRDAFRLWRGQESAILVISFECHEIHLKYYDAAGKPAHEADFYLGENSDGLARLAKKAMPSPATPRKRNQSR
jgi:hypothetical protein